MLLIRTINIFFEVIYWSIIINSFLSWFPSLKNSLFASIISAISQPVLAPIRKLLYKLNLFGKGMMIDFHL